jgi:hypothetical protein
MDDTSLAGFIERLQHDDELRERVVAAETELATTIGRETDAITQIAADAGYDISGWSSSPRGIEPDGGDVTTLSFCCTFTCCLTGTSA